MRSPTRLFPRWKRRVAQQYMRPATVGLGFQILASVGRHPDLEPPEAIILAHVIIKLTLFDELDGLCLRVPPGEFFGCAADLPDALPGIRVVALVNPIDEKDSCHNRKLTIFSEPRQGQAGDNSVTF